MRRDDNRALTSGGGAGCPAAQRVHQGPALPRRPVHRTKRSALRMAAAMDHQIETAGTLRTAIEVEDDLARLTIAVNVPSGKKLQLTKFLADGWSAQRSIPALRAQVDAALGGALRTGWDGLLTEQRQFLDEFWASADIEIDGDPELQQAVRFSLFHVLQAGARGESRAIPGKGLTGPGYGGHAFWDTETFVLQQLTYTLPDAARDALLAGDTPHWIKRRKRARQLGLKGAAFPWRSINGDECSAYWPAGTAAFHVNADIADATVRYLNATQDTEFERECGTELLVETARLWASLGHHDPHGGFRIDGVTGPDEYSAVGAGQQHLHQPDGATKSPCRRRCMRTAPRHRRGTRGRPRRGHGLAGSRT